MKDTPFRTHSGVTPKSSLVRESPTYLRELRWLVKYLSNSPQLFVLLGISCPKSKLET